MIPVPSPFKIALLKRIIQWLMDGLIETVFTTDLATDEERGVTSRIEDAYYGLQDALEALEDIKWEKTSQPLRWWKLKKSGLLPKSDGESRTG